MLNLIFKVIMYVVLLEETLKVERYILYAELTIKSERRLYLRAFPKLEFLRDWLLRVPLY